jgi:hypothetical protein
MLSRMPGRAAREYGHHLGAAAMTAMTAMILRVFCPSCCR